MEEINTDCMIKILSHLDFQTKLKCTMVCKKWYELSKYIFENNVSDVVTICSCDYKNNKENIDNWLKKYRPNMSIIMRDDISNVHIYFPLLR